MRSERVSLPDGSSTIIEWFGNASKDCKAVIVFLPALGVNVGYYRTLCETWAERGYRVAAFEMRGMKQSSVRNVKRNNFGYKEVLTLDLPTLIGKVANESFDAPIYLAGHSLGGQFALLYASRAPARINGVILIAGGSNHFASLGSGWARFKRRLGFCLIRLVCHLIGFFPGDKLGFGGRQPLNLMLDWSNEGLTGRYQVIGDTTDYNKSLADFNKPVLLLSLGGDLLVPQTSAHALARKVKQAVVTHIELKAKDYGLKVFSHFKWVYQPNPVLNSIDQWVKKTS